MLRGSDDTGTQGVFEMTQGSNRIGVAVAMSLSCFLMAGCGKNVVLVPVAGSVTLNGQPLSKGVVTFMPDLAKGNSAQSASTGAIDRGSYQLSTLGQLGASPGWYKVIIEDALMENDPLRPAEKSVIPNKYRYLRTTDLAVEVEANPKPGAYDLKLHRR
jgi:hypothetical protein